MTFVDAPQRPPALPVTGEIERALAALAAGGAIVALGADADPRARLVFAAELATPELLAFVVRHTSGLVRAPAAPVECARLRLPQMTMDNQHPRGAAYTVTVDAAEGVSTGISARDRARTLRLLGSADATPESFSRPGHVLPMRAVPGGLAQRRGHTELAVALMQHAGVRPVAGSADLLSNDGATASAGQARAFAARHGLAVVVLS